MSEIDLHTHSTASDGTFTPSGLIDEAASIGLRAMALTDHDTVAGLEEAARRARDKGVEFIPGCELTVQLERRTVDVLGYWIPGQTKRLGSALDQLNEERRKRNEYIVQRLQKLGIHIIYDDVLALADGTVGRPHIAQALCNAGVVSSVQEAFNRYLGSRGQAYVAKKVFSPEEALELLVAEGATPVLAHPGIYGFELSALHRLCQRLKDHGLVGLEIFYSEHSGNQVYDYTRLADKLDLIPTGGSDFHGAVKPLIQLGNGKDNLDIPYSVLERLKEQRTRNGLPV
jgi:predicted metal-dependent phosphoesterase TrpH